MYQFLHKLIFWRVSHISLSRPVAGMDYQGGDMGGASQGYAATTPGSGNKGGPRKSYDEQTLLPVTCRMILSAPSDGTSAMTLPDGRPLHHVKLVGAVRSVEHQSTNVTYQIEDGTGLLEVKQWMDDNDCTAIQEMKDEAAKENQYLRIVGQVKDYDGRKSVLSHSVRKLQSADELTHHFLEVVYSGENAKRADRIGGVPVMSMAVTSTPLAAPQSSGVGDALKDHVMNFIKVDGEHSDTGANVHKCIQALSGQYSEHAIRAAIEDLASEGHVYSTVNEDYYKCAM
jgi:replication factor A2